MRRGAQLILTAASAPRELPGAEPELRRFHPNMPESARSGLSLHSHWAGLHCSIVRQPRHNSPAVPWTWGGCAPVRRPALARCSQSVLPASCRTSARSVIRFHSSAACSRVLVCHTLYKQTEFRRFRKQLNASYHCLCVINKNKNRI